MHNFIPLCFLVAKREFWKRKNAYVHSCQHFQWLQTTHIVWPVVCPHIFALVLVVLLMQASPSRDLLRDIIQHEVCSLRMVFVSLLSDRLLTDGRLASHVSDFVVSPRFLLL